MRRTLRSHLIGMKGFFLGGRVIRRLFLFVFLKIGLFKWVVDKEGDVGFRIYGVNIINYKWNDTMIITSNKTNSTRLADKRELCSSKSFEKA